MDEFYEPDIRTLCCTCLSVDRKLFQLCRINDGVNYLYWLLSYDLEAYKEGFLKDSTNFFICWECKALMLRICLFRKQVCIAQKKLSVIEEGKIQIKCQISLSKLSTVTKNSYDKEHLSGRDADSRYIFIDCGEVASNIKIEEEESDEDIPLSELQNYSDNEQVIEKFVIEKEHDSKKKEELLVERVRKSKRYPIDMEKKAELLVERVRKIKRHPIDSKKEESLLERVRKRKRYPLKRKRKTDPDADEYKVHYTTTEMTEEEMLDSREQKRLTGDYIDAPNKCESCIVGYKSESNLEKHKTLHVPRRKTEQCPICLLYINIAEVDEHRKSHYSRRCCNYCAFTSCDTIDVLRHLKKGHDMRDIVVPRRFKKGEGKTPPTKNPGSRPRVNIPMMDKPTPLGYRCSDCDKYFQDKRHRYVHILKYHREGFKCDTCGKRFSFKHNLQKHVRLHQGPPPREQCPKCGKMIQVSLMSTHAKTHEPRTSYTCTECNKHFVSRESYEMHLKYTLRHAKIDIHKFKCSMCDKGYRSRLELKDHIDYSHLGQTQYKCHICNKPFSSHKSYICHVRHTHEGFKDKKNRICKECGKAFSNKKGLREHERIHTGERPLYCEICGATFRQNSSLCTHRKRVHNVYPPRRKEVKVLESNPTKGAPLTLQIAPGVYKCHKCEKGYRSQGELQDHINYQHMGRTRHKCPMCDKPLATRRCMTRHIRRAHHGIKENARDKICQQCGKAFRDKKGLREHELIHTGERPLACEICGCTFRQSASLYTHRKRVHHVYPLKKAVEVLGE